ncbi:unnamed protein product [Moneuplotes crassus]|uniref:Protein kinase domain-containing protein n=1 Tax=Euplotes crassus TaxID=5936 RepID=A0AAD1XCP8_EUPCR|nr:unnamed protein product [Moneuplotes crassus]
MGCQCISSKENTEGKTPLPRELDENTSNGLKNRMDSSTSSGTAGMRVDTETTVPEETKIPDSNGPSPSDFQVRAQIGRGGHCKVFSVKSNKTGGYYAMKVVRLKNLPVEYQEEIIAQKQTFKDINCYFLSKLHHHFVAQRKLYFITDLVKGTKLSDYLYRKFQVKEKAIKFYAAEMVIALKALHDNDVTYPGLTPGNIMIDTQGHVKILEPGRSNIQNITTLLGQIEGTSHYVAPEVVQGNELSHINDWWSLGAILYEMVSGYPPFLKFSENTGEMEFTLVKNNQIFSSKKISTSFKDFLKKLLCIDPENRLGAGGAEEIMKHEFFDSLIWESIALKQQETPYLPKEIPVSSPPQKEKECSKDFEEWKESPRTDKPCSYPSKFLPEFCMSNDVVLSVSTNE